MAWNGSTATANGGMRAGARSARSLLTYPFRRAATLATLLDRPDDLLMPMGHAAARSAGRRRGRRRRARTRRAWRATPIAQIVRLHVPSYEQVFRTLSISIPDVQLSGNARDDARAVLEAIRGGHVYSTIDALATPAAIRFHGNQRRASRGHGRTSATRRPGHRCVSRRTHLPGRASRLLSDGKTVASGAPPALDYEAPPAPGVYRVEVDVAGAPGTPPVPWVVSNPIYVGLAPGLGHFIETACDLGNCGGLHAMALPPTGASRRAFDPKAASVSRPASRAHNCSCVTGLAGRCRNRRMSPPSWRPVPI